MQDIALGTSPSPPSPIAAAAAAAAQPYGWPPAQQPLYPQHPLQVQAIQPQLLHPSVAALRSGGMPGSAGDASRRCFSAPTSPRAASTGGSGGRPADSPQTLIRVGVRCLGGWLLPQHDMAACLMQPGVTDKLRCVKCPTTSRPRLRLSLAPTVLPAVPLPPPRPSLAAAARLPPGAGRRRD